MDKKAIAIIIELIPIICAPISYVLVTSGFDSPLVRNVILVTFLCAFLGFVFFIIGRRMAGEAKPVRILGILDLLATVYVVGFYALAKKVLDYNKGAPYTARVLLNRCG